MVGRSGVLAHTLPVGIVRRAATFNQDIKALIPKSGFDSDYIALFLRAQQSYVLSQGVKIGATVHSLKSGFIEALEIPAISIDEQICIVSRLKSQLSSLEEARQAAQAQLSEIRQLKTQALKAVFVAIEKTCLIGDVARIQSGYAFKSETFKKQGVGLLRNANMAPGRVYWDDAVYLSPAAAPAHAAYALAAGDVLISLDRPIISTGIKVARVAASDLPALLVQRVGRFRIDETQLDADYLYAFLHTEPFIEAISGHEQSLGVPHVSPGQIEAIEIPLPSLEEQQRLAVILNNISQATQQAKTAAELQLRDIELLPSRRLAQVFNTQEDHQDDKQAN